MKQFRNYDAPRKPQAVTITFERVLIPDEFAGPPDEQDEGFWPSHDPDAAGYVLPENYDEQYELAQERMRAWEADQWQYVGVICRAHISVPIGSDSFCNHTIDSAGLWGIESDAGDYLDEVYKDQEAELRSQLELMGQAFLELGS